MLSSLQDIQLKPVEKPVKTSADDSRNKEQKERRRNPESHRESKKYQSLDSRYNSSGIHRREKKNAHIERGKGTNSAEGSEGHSSVRRENHEAKLSSRHAEKTREQNRSSRHDTQAGSTEDGRSRSKVPLRVKPLALERPPQQDSEKHTTKAQVCPSLTLPAFLFTDICSTSRLL